MVGTALRAVRSQGELRMSSVLTAGSESRPYPNKKGVLADALFKPATFAALCSKPRAYWQASQVPPLRMASMEHAFFSSAVYSFFSALGTFSTVAFSMLEAPRVRR